MGTDLLASLPSAEEPPVVLHDNVWGHLPPGGFQRCVARDPILDLFRERRLSLVTRERLRFVAGRLRGRCAALVTSPEEQMEQNDDVEKVARSLRDFLSYL